MAMKLLQDLRKLPCFQTNILVPGKEQTHLFTANIILGLDLSPLSQYYFPAHYEAVTGPLHRSLTAESTQHTGLPWRALCCAQDEDATGCPVPVAGADLQDGASRCPLTWYLLTRSCLICSNFLFSSLCRSSRFCARPTYTMRPLISFPFMSATACQRREGL